MPVDDIAEVSRLETIFDLQRAAFARAPSPAPAQRIDRIERLKALLKDNIDAFAQTLADDFSVRSPNLSLFGDIKISIDLLNAALETEHLWTQREERLTPPPFDSVGSKSYVYYQPLGVVGNMATWNFPVQVCLAPLGEIFAAGNNAIVKASEYAPATADLVHDLVVERFDETELAVIRGGAVVGRAFASTAFDHLLFTGSPRVGRLIAAAAAENLTPLTLELGGKSPVIFGRTADWNIAVMRMLFIKTLNAGQICTSPDYLFAPAAQLSQLVDAVRAASNKMFPSYYDSADYTGLISGKTRERLDALKADAVEKGARVIGLDESPASGDRRYAPALVLGVTDNMRIMQEEIFGPLLPIVTYDDFSEVVTAIAEGEKPLTMSYFGDDPDEIDALLARTSSGGITINDVAGHVLNPYLPFGGVGESGYGAYHGADGFRRFSHLRSVYEQSTAPFDEALRPPWTPAFGEMLKGAL